MSLHLRQYVVGPRPLVAQPGWRSRKLPSGQFLSHCPTLPVVDTPHGIVLGDAVNTHADGGPEDWAGRWLRLTDSHLRLDTCGLLACYLREIESARWASSSPEILRTIEPELPMHEDRLERDWRVMDWYPSPRSAIEGIDRLLPSQALPLAGGPIEREVLPAGVVAFTVDEVMERWRDRLILFMEAASALADDAGGRVWIGLTGGHDSRMLLAAALAAGVKAMTYTFVRPQTSSGDREVPPVIAKSAGLEHMTVSLDDIDADRAAEFERHTAASFSGGAWLQHATNAWSVTEPGAVVVEGGTLEVARCYYWPRLPTVMGDTVDDATETVLKRFPSQRPEGVRAWVEWVRGPGRQEDLDWRDRFFLEQRCGSWLSAGLQGFDLSGRRMLYPGNCHALLAEGLGLPEDARHASVHQDGLVERLAPGLAAFPYNPGSKKATKKAKQSARIAGGGARQTTLSSRFERIGRRLGR